MTYFYSSIFHPFLLFFFNDTATTEIYTLSLHDALPICGQPASEGDVLPRRPRRLVRTAGGRLLGGRSEEHTSELQSRQYLVCRLLLEKKKTYVRSYIVRTPLSIPLTTIFRRSTTA